MAAAGGEHVPAASRPSCEQLVVRPLSGVQANLARADHERQCAEVLIVGNFGGARGQIMSGAALLTLLFLGTRGSVLLAVLGHLVASQQVVSLYPGLVHTEAVVAAGVFDLSNSESPEFIGRAVAALAGDVSVSRWSGQVVTAAALGTEYGFTDVDGRQPRPLAWNAS